VAEAVQTTALLVEDFDAEQITPVRHAVSRRAESAGLRGQRLEDFVLAVNEIVTNAVRHAGGGGSLRMWSADGEVVCEVTGQALPPSHAISGRGLWLAHHLVDEVDVRTGDGGTIVTLKSAVDD
jgi:anti-sigma regulatory factor (Ser/Thr protein kinase)